MQPYEAKMMNKLYHHFPLLVVMADIHPFSLSLSLYESLFIYINLLPIMNPC